MNHRRCIVTRRSLPRDRLVRFVVAPDGTVVPDLAERLPGRGVWVTAGRPEISRAAATGGFARAVRARATAPSDLADRVEAGLLERVIMTIGLCRRAGLAMDGHAKAAAAITAGKVALRLEAPDGSAGPRRALDRLDPAIPVIAVLSGSELARAFERDRLVHVAVTHGSAGSGGLVARLCHEAGRLAAFRGIPDAAQPGEHTETGTKGHGGVTPAREGGKRHGPPCPDSGKSRRG